LIRRFAASRPTRWLILCCCWHKGLSGTLESVWNMKYPDAAAAADDSAICSLNGGNYRATPAALQQSAARQRFE
jgi:hypothetical protein